jgi:hypothetical protein
VTPDPDRKPTPEERRTGGLVTLAVLVFIAVFTVIFVLSA